MLPAVPAARLYEDMIAGRISEQNFNTMLERTQTEQTELKTKVSEGRKRLPSFENREINWPAFASFAITFVEIHML